MGKFGLNFLSQLKSLMVIGQYLKVKAENGKKCTVNDGVTTKK